MRYLHKNRILKQRGVKVKYRIDIKEILLKTIEVEADNHFEAIEKVKKKYNNGDITFDASDRLDTDFIFNEASL